LVFVDDATSALMELLFCESESAFSYFAAMRSYLGRHGKKRADYIISGLPWASLPLKVQDNILREVLSSLAPGGLFITFGYLHARWMPNALRFRRKLEQHFTRVEPSGPIWGNFPPAFVYRCTR
jgi:phospholipid N-methyltransferase